MKNRWITPILIFSLLYVWVYPCIYTYQVQASNSAHVETPVNHSLQPVAVSAVGIGETIAGFTLAEVLITLTIIGVIAALTIPALLQNIQDQQLKVAWKRMFTDLKQATSRVMMDNGGTMVGLCNDLDYNCSKLNNEYKTYFGYIKECNTHPSADGCWHSENNWFYLNNAPAGQFDDSPRHYYDWAGSLILKNGSLIAYDWLSSSCTFGDWSGPAVKCGHIIVDVNGFKGPNIVGKDIFAIWITADGLKPVGTVNVDSFINTGWGYATKYLMQ